MRKMISSRFRIIAYFDRFTKYCFESIFVHMFIVIITFQMNFEHRKEFLNKMEIEKIRKKIKNSNIVFRAQISNVTMMMY